MAIATSTLIATSAVIGAGAAVVGTISNISAQRKAAEAAKAGFPVLPSLSAAQARNVFGERPEIQNYTPYEQGDPGFAAVAGRTISGNQRNLKKAVKLSDGVNTAITASAKTRATGWDPKLIDSLTQMYQNRGNRLAGNLSYGDAMAATAGVTRRSNDLGAGGSGFQVAADLGLRRMDIQDSGANLSLQIQQILNGIDPISRHTTPESYQVNVNNAAQMSVSDNQFAATYAAQQAQIEAMADPAAAGMFQLKMMQAGMNSQRSMMPQGPSWGQMIGQAGGAISGALGAYGQYQASKPQPYTGASYQPGGAAYSAATTPMASTYTPHNLSARPAGL